MKTISFAVLILLAALAACERKGPAEKAGEAIDRAGERAAENVRDAAKGK